MDSVLGIGSTFSFTARLDRQPLGAVLPQGLRHGSQLPVLYLATEHAVGTSRPHSPPIVADAPAPKPAGRILLAEDSPVNREVAVGMLELLGYELDVVENGQQALMASDSDNIDMILMDCQMPEMDGLTVTGRIRQRERSSGRRRLPIIALTAHAMQGDREQCLAAGMDDYLTKPYTQMQLRDMVLKWLSKQDPESSTAQFLFQPLPDSAPMHRFRTIDD